MRYLALTLLPILLLFGCQKVVDDKKHDHDLTTVLTKRDLYLDNIQHLTDGYGWLPFRCDSLLFNSLAAYSGFQVNINLAEKDDGHWFRKPDASECRVISKDMFRGLFIYLLDTGSVEKLKAIQTYGETHNWFMGETENKEEQFGRALMSPSMQYQLQRMIQRLSGQKLDKPLDVPPDSEPKSSYPAHLQMLDIWTDFMIDGYVLPNVVELLKRYIEKEPNNALFQAIAHAFIDGDQTEAMRLLLRDEFFPATKLPMNTQYCGDYLWERDFDEFDGQGRPFWAPCEEIKVHTPVDFIFAAEILERTKN